MPLDVELFRWWLPPPADVPEGAPYLSPQWMTREEAARCGAIAPDLSTREVLRQVGPGTSRPVVQPKQQRIEQWQVISLERLKGTAYDRHDRSDGGTIVTTPVREVRWVGTPPFPMATTDSGSEYRLGRPDPEFGVERARQFILSKSPTVNESHSEDPWKSTDLQPLPSSLPPPTLPGGLAPPPGAPARDWLVETIVIDATTFKPLNGDNT